MSQQKTTGEPQTYILDVNSIALKHMVGKMIKCFSSDTTDPRAQQDAPYLYGGLYGRGNPSGHVGIGMSTLFCTVFIRSVVGTPQATYSPRRHACAGG